MPKKIFDKKGLAARAAKKALSIGTKILIELIEEQRDLNFFYFHRSYGWRPVRELRYEHEYYEARKNEYARRREVARLRKNKLIALRKEGGRIIARLTDDGRIKAVRALIRVSQNYLANGKICLVSFDFPEAARAARYGFRRFLKQAGFRFVQGSVWSINKDVYRDLDTLIGLLGIGRWVKIFIAEK